MTDKRIDEDKCEKMEKAKINAQTRTGCYLKTLRLEKGLSLTSLGDKLGVSAAYLSNVESGTKTMSDHFVRQMANFHKIDENIIFDLLKRVPLLAKEQLEEESNLQQLLSDIKRNKRFDDEKKQKLFDQMYRLYKKFSEEDLHDR